MVNVVLLQALLRKLTPWMATLLMASEIAMAPPFSSHREEGREEALRASFELFDPHLRPRWRRHG
jgi:hypothetical protein